MAVRIEDAGFEIRDMIAWVYGSGFPKSMDVSKAIDKAAGAEREVVGEGPYSSRRPRAEVKSQNAYQDGIGDYGSSLITAPATDAAKQWQGWGTSLKPALEPITMARKPLEGTVAANVLAHGCGGLNVDGCRVEGAIGVSYRTTGNGEVGSGGVYQGGYRGEWNASNPHTESVRHNAAGRWPANLIHDGSDEVLELFPETTSGVLNQANVKANDRIYGGGFGNGKTSPRKFEANSGSAARFFYCAKASRSERGKDNTHPTVKPLALMRYLVRLVTPPGGLVLDPFAGSGTTLLAARLEGAAAIGVELDEKHCEIIARRLDDGLAF
jgi:site-specific DNA-methyltransferase (adenine-specific)